MIERLSVALSVAWAESDIIEASDVDMYKYGLELLISMLANTVVISVVSLLFGYPWAFAPFLLSLFPLRAFGGGFHASTYRRCIALSSSIFTGCLLMMLLITDRNISTITCVSIAIISLVAQVLIAPVPAKNKPLTTYETKRNRIITLVGGTIMLIFGAVFSFSDMMESLSVKMFFCGEAMSTALLLGGYVDNARKEN